MSNTPYQLSGRIGLGWLLPIVGLIPAATIGLIYAYANVYNPLIYIQFLLAAMLPVGAVFPIAYLAKPFKCRSVAFMRVAGVLTGIASLVFAWMFFMPVLFISNGMEGMSIPYFFVNPSEISVTVQALSAEGYYSIGSFTPTGIILWIAWLIEAGIVISGSWKIADTKIRDLAFCEDCNTWCEPSEAVAIPADVGGIASAVRKQGLSMVTEVAAPSEGAKRWVVLSSQECSSCQQMAVFSAEELKDAVNDDGNTETVSKTLIPMSLRSEEDNKNIGRIRTLLDEADTQRFDALKSDTQESSKSETA